MGWGVSLTPWPPLPLGKTRYPLYRRLGGPQVRSGRAKNHVPTGTRSQTVKPVVSRYTDWTTWPTIVIVWFNKYSVAKSKRRVLCDTVAGCDVGKDQFPMPLQNRINWKKANKLWKLCHTNGSKIDFKYMKSVSYIRWFRLVLPGIYVKINQFQPHLVFNAPVLSIEELSIYWPNNERR